MKTHKPTMQLFFAKTLTLRQLLTRRAIVLGVAAPVLIAGFLWTPSWLAMLGPADAVPDARADDAPKARLLTVNLCTINEAGPPTLKQGYSGILTARRTSQLASKVVGRVEKVLADLGDTVAAGQVLLELDSRQFAAQRAALAARLANAQAQLDELVVGPRQQEIEQAIGRISEIEARLNLGRINLSRASQLRSTASISQQEFDEQKFQVDALAAQLKTANEALDMLQEGSRVETIAAQRASVSAIRADLDAVDVQLADLTIRAPYAGRIQQRMVDEGAVVSAGQSLFEIAESGALEIHVGLPTQLVERIESGSAQVNVRLPVPQPYPTSETEAASILRVAPALDPATRTQEVVLAAPLAFSQFALGSSVRIEVEQIAESSGFWVPSKALTAASRGLWAVLVAKPTEDPKQFVAERRQVELLRSQGEWSEIRGPIDGHELLIPSGVHRVVPGQAVQGILGRRSGAEQGASDGGKEQTITGSTQTDKALTKNRSLSTAS